MQINSTVTLLKYDSIAICSNGISVSETKDLDRRIMHDFEIEEGKKLSDRWREFEIPSSKNFTYKNANVLVPLFKSLVRPILEYGNVVWSNGIKKRTITVLMCHREHNG